MLDLEFDFRVVPERLADAEDQAQRADAAGLGLPFPVAGLFGLDGQPVLAAQDRAGLRIAREVERRLGHRHLAFEPLRHAIRNRLDGQPQDVAAAVELDRAFVDARRFSGDLHSVPFVKALSYQLSAVSG